MKCTSCGTYLESEKNSVRFPCPTCDQLIGRCRSCKIMSTTYVCACGFTGP